MSSYGPRDHGFPITQLGIVDNTDGEYANAVALQTAEQPLTAPLSALVEKQHWGVLTWTRLPGWVEVPLAVILLDYTLYMWRVLTHRVP